MSRKKNSLGILLWTAAALIVLVVALTAAQSESIYKLSGREALHVWSEGWHYVEEGRVRDVEEAPQIVIAGDSDGIILNQVIPVLKNDQILSFYTMFHKVEVSAGDDILLSYGHKSKIGNYDSMTGNYLCMVSIPKEYSGKTLSVRLSHSHGKNRIIIPVMYLDSERAVLHNIWHKDGMRMIFCIIMLIMVFVLLLLGALLYLRENIYVRSLILASAFILASAVWIFTDSNLPLLFEFRPQLICIISFCSFFILPVPLLGFADSVCKEHCRFLRILEVLTGINLLIQLALYLGGVFDLIQMLPVTHGLFFAVILTTGIYMYMEWKARHSFGAKIYLLGALGLTGMSVVSVCVLFSDAREYYHFFYEIGLMGFVTILGWAAVSQANEALQLSERHRLLKKLEYVDLMTKMGNRKACECYLEKTQIEVQTGQKIMAAVIDVNGLREVNENLGHEMGDNLITGASKCIRNVFGGVGEVFRTGGSKFVVIILDDIGPEDYRSALRKSVTDHNRKFELKVSLSAGVVNRERPADDPDWLYKMMYEADMELEKEKRDGLE